MDNLHYLCSTKSNKGKDMHLQPNAKLNLGLNVTARRPDGYHDIETVFLPIRLHDELIIERDDSRNGITLHITDGIPLDCSNEENLIVRTYKHFAKRYNIGGVCVRFRKYIPFGAGLGGGSSDAAHTAIALNTLFSLSLNKEQLKQEVSHLGADCAFFIENTPCHATGIGDILTPLPLSLSSYCLVLVKPDIHVATKNAYSGITPQPPIYNLTDTLQLPVEEWNGKVTNDFERSVFAQFPAIAAVKQHLYAMGAAYAAMSGSGASVFGIFRTDNCPDKRETAAAFSDCFVYRELLS